MTELMMQFIFISYSDSSDSFSFMNEISEMMPPDNLHFNQMMLPMSKVVNIP